MAKLLERVVVSRLFGHIQLNNLQQVMQSAYNQGHSTETALLKVQNDVLTAMDSQKVTLLVLLDLSAAFDTINHSILLNRLCHRIGVKDAALRWFQSYLEGHTQMV